MRKRSIQEREKMNSIIDSDTWQAHEGIRARADQVQRTLFLDRDDEQIDELAYIDEVIIGS